MTRVIVLGGGIAGLATAWYLGRSAPPDLDLDVRVIEPAATCGGRIQSDRDGGTVFEWGPHGFLDNAPETLELADAVGLGSRRIESRADARRRFVLHGGRLKEVPHSPGGLFRSDLLGAGAKLRLFLEPFVRKGDFVDESVAAFAARRLGKGVVAPLLEPFVTGVYAGDPAQLSVRCAFPQLWQLEREHGSLLRGMMRRGREQRQRGEPRRTPVLCSFRDGMAELPRALKAALGNRCHAGVRVRAVLRDGDGYAVELDGGPVPVMRADVLVLAVPTAAAAGLTEGFDRDLAATLRTIPHAGIAVVYLSFPRGRVGGDVEAFGFLCARAERRDILGCIYASSVFEGHAEPDTVVLRALLGGVHRPELAEQGDDALAGLALRDLAPLLELRGEPERVRVFKHPRGIPQYTLGHQSRLAAIDSVLRKYPTLFVTGAGYRGVSVNDCIANAKKVAGNVVRFLLHR